MGNYLQMGSQQHIRALLELGWSHRRIAREVGVHRETVARHAVQLRPKQANLIAGSGEQNRPKPIPGPPPTAAPYHDFIQAGVDQGLSAQRIWQDLCEERGYCRGYLSVQRYVRRLKRQRPEVADVLEHPPGKEGQIDYFRAPSPTFDAASGKWRRPWVFRLTLSCSKHGYEEGMWTQDRSSFLRAHEHGFEAIGGVPEVIRHDNLKAAVVRACLYDPDVSEVYAAFAEHWGFVPLPGRPRHPQEQGVAENSSGYVKKNALKGRRFSEGLEGLNEFLRRWNRTVAQVRIHGTTRKQVLAHFLEVEKPALQALPGERFALFEVGTRVVHPDGYVEVDGNYYTAPHHLMGQEVKVHWDDRLVRIYHQGHAVRVHLRQHQRGTYVTNPEDRPAHKPARQQAYQETLLAKAERIGERTLAWGRAAVDERDVRAYRLLQGVIALTRSHPKERIDWACGVALEGRAFRYRTLRRLVEQAAARSPQAPLRLTQEHELIRPLGQYAQLAIAPTSAGGVP